MFEHKKQPLLSRRLFIGRMLRSLLLATLLCSLSLMMGMLGYHMLEHLPWIDAFLNASMILGGMGPVDAMKTDAGKLFAGGYALFSGLFMVLSMGILLTPVIHRVIHHFHAEHP